MSEFLQSLLEQNNITGKILGALFDNIVGIIFGAIVAGFLYYRAKAVEFIKTRHVRDFWKEFMGDSLTIIVVEYPISGDSRLAKIAQVAGTGWLISKGMALSLAKLLDFCPRNVTERKHIFISGDRTGGPPTDNVVILGSPANNPHARSWTSHLSDIYDLPFWIRWSENSTEIAIEIKDGSCFSPVLDDGVGQDFALVVKAKYQNVPEKSVILVSGCYMWGTLAGVEAITDLRILNEVARVTSGAQNVCFIVKTRVVNDWPTGPELDIGNRTYIQALIPRTHDFGTMNSTQLNTVN